MGEKIKKPKEKISRPLANSRIRAMASEDLEERARIFGLDLEKTEPELVRASLALNIDIWTARFLQDHEIVNPGEE